MVILVGTNFFALELVAPKILFSYESAQTISIKLLFLNKARLD